MTDQPKWTPGPWAAKWSKYEEDNFIVQAGMPSNRVLAQFDGDGDGPDDQSLADAHLIAAAPDMATVLEYYADKFCEGFCEDLPQAGTYQTEMDLDCSGCKARAALAKARGQA